MRFVNLIEVTTQEHSLVSLIKSTSCLSWIRMDPLRYFLTGATASPMIQMLMTRFENPHRTACVCSLSTENILPGRTNHANNLLGLYVPLTFTNKIIVSYLGTSHVICSFLWQPHKFLFFFLRLGFKKKSSLYIHTKSNANAFYNWCTHFIYILLEPAFYLLGLGYTIKKVVFGGLPLVWVHIA